MQVPTRRADKMRVRDDSPLYVTDDALARMHQSLERCERDVPELAAEVARLKENGDLSENFEYQEAKHRLRQLHGRIASLKDKIKRAVVIMKDSSGRVRLGSTVVVESRGKRMTFEILGPLEADPSHGRISDRSPLGSALLGHTAGDAVLLETKSGVVEYHIIEVR